MSSQRSFRHFVISFLYCGALAGWGCGSDDTKPDPTGAEGGAGGAADDGAGGIGSDPTRLEIEGRWTSNFDTEETISSERWGTQTVVVFDNTENTAVTQNPPDDMFNPDKFNALVWTELESESFYYCMIEFGLDTAELARASMSMADASDPENAGCGGFAWTKLTRAEP